MKRESPQVYINRILSEKALTHVKAAEIAQRLGHKLSSGYIHNIARGTADNPSVQLVKALAAAIGRPEDEVFDVFRGKQLNEEKAYKESFWAMLWSEFDKLPNGDQKELRPTLEMLQREIERRLAAVKPTTRTR